MVCSSAGVARAMRSGRSADLLTTMDDPPALADRCFHYTVFGLTVRSEIELPELNPVDPAAFDVDIGYRDLSAAAPGTSDLSVTADGALLWVPQIGRYRIERGCRILVDPADGVSSRNMRLFLLGSAFGALLHQRGLLPLHANAIVIDGHAVAFAGASGAGKSTLAALLHDRGYPLLSDDVCVIGLDDAGRAIAQAGVPRMRLWHDAVERSGRDARDFERALDGREKYYVPARRHDAPAALGAIYVLKRAGDDGEGQVGIRRLRGAEALNAVLAHTYRGRYVAPLGETRRHWTDCRALIARVPVFELERPWDPALLPATIAAVEAHLHGAPA